MKYSIWLLMILLVASATAQTWQLVNPLPAGRADDIAIGYTAGPPVQQYLYIADHLSWPFISTNGGVSWDSLSGDPDATYSNAIITKPDDAEEVWIGRYDVTTNTGYGVSYSTDGGVNWVQRNPPNLMVLTLEMAPDNYDVIFAGCNSTPNVFKTLDGGIQWTTLSSPTSGSVYDIETAPVPYDNILLAACDNGISKSTDYGNTWELKYSAVAWDIARDPSNDGHFYAAVVVFSQGKILKSTNYGDLWEVDYVLPANQYPKKIAINPSPWRIFVATENAGVYWKNTTTPWQLDGSTRGIYDKLATSIAVDVTTPNILLYGTATALYRNTDFPTNSWELSVSGMRTIYPAAFSPSLPDAIFAKAVRPWVDPISGSTATAGISLYKSLNESNTWDIIHSAYSYEDNIRGPHTLVVHPDNSLQIYLAFEHSGIDAHTIHSTTNGGLNWNIHNYASGCMWQSIAVDQNTQIAYEADDTQWPENQRDPQVLITDDGGQNWREAGTMTGAPRSIACYPIEKDTIYIGTAHNDVYRSEDSGDNWTSTGNISGDSISCLAIDYVNHAILYAGSKYLDPGVYKTSNRGNDWIQMNNDLNYPLVKSIITDPEEPAIVYAATYHRDEPPYRNYGHCYQSVDGARQWIELEPIPNNREIYDLQIDYNQPNKVYAVTTDGNYSPYPKPTGLYTYTPPFINKSLTSSSSKATSINNGKKIIRGGINDFWGTYESGGVIYAVHSSDGGMTWSRKMEIGEGYNPAISFNPNPETPKPGIVWWAQGSRDTIYFARHTSDYDWTAPVPIVTTDYDYGPPSFVVGTDGKGRVVYTNTEHNHLYYTEFDFYNPVPSTDPDFGSGINPSINFMTPGGSHPEIHVVWEDNNKIKYRSRTASGTWGNQETVSPNNSHHPSIEVSGTNVYVVWERFGNIEYCYAVYTNGSHYWSKIGDFESSYSLDYPVFTGGSAMSCFADVNGKGEIYFWYNAGTGWTGPINISNSQDVESNYPHMVHKQTLDRTTVYFAWTENDDPVFDIKLVTYAFGGSNPDADLAFYIAEAGDTTPSPFNRHREGYLHYGAEFYQQIDYDSEYLEYQYEMLDPDKEYVLAAYAYQEGYGNLSITIKIDNILIGGIILPPDTLIVRKEMLPLNLYADSTVNVKIYGNDAVCAALVLYEYENDGSEGGGPQSSGNVQYNNGRLFLNVFPNQVNKEFIVRYVLPQETKVSLSLYDVSGRMVSKLIYSHQQIGSYHKIFDTKNLSQGVYFVKLDTGEESIVQKVVFLR